MAGSSFQSSSSTSQSTSTPTIYPTPQSDFSLQLAQLLSQLGQAQSQWAQQVYAQTGQITDAQINNYLQMAQQGSDLAGNLLGRYMGTFAPLEDQYAREAQTYGSEARIAHEMGRAEANAKQAADVAKINAENELESFGIDPSSGRYQDLILASNTKAAADAAAAGEQARVNVEQQAQQRKLNAIMMGQQLPGATVNALNSAYQGIAGAENAALGLANTGVNLMTSPNQFFANARNPQQPLFGNQGQSTGRSISTGGSNSSGGGGGGGSRRSDPFNSDRFGRGSPSPGGGSSPGYNPNLNRGVKPAYIQNPYTNKTIPVDPSTFGTEENGGWPSMFQPPDQIMYDPSGYADPSGYDIGSVYENNGYQNVGWDPNAGFGGSVQDMWGANPYWMGGLNNTSGPSTDWGFSNPYSSPGSYYSPDYNYNGGYDTLGMDPSGDMWGSWDSTALQPNYGTPDASWGDYGASDYSDYGGYDAYSGDYGASDYSDYGGYDAYSGGDYGGGYDDYSDYSFAKGGPVSRRPLPRGNNQQGGGFVPPSMSPSAGRRVDDIPAVVPQTGGRAQINAGEFVLPRDVVAWKGQEFFQKMIEQARKARTGASAKPSVKRPGGFNG